MSLGQNPILQLARAARGRSGWSWRSGAATHTSGAVVEPCGPVFVIRGEPREFIMPDSALIHAERAHRLSQTEQAFA